MSGRSRRPPLRKAQVATALALALGALVVVAGNAAPSDARSPKRVPRVQASAAQRAFIAEVGAVARRLRDEIGLPPSLVVAMAINDTGWGQSTLARRARNYFGIKALVGVGTAGYVIEETQEHLHGRTVTVRAPFRAYTSLEDSARDLGQFLRSNPRYAGVQGRHASPGEAARALAAAGYATDPTWADKLIRLIEEYALEDLDSVS
jgi:flagellum-specific peptidoglycan hydrolase FlgJ